MSNTKHSPTPWIAEGQQIVTKENGYRVATVSSPDPRARGKERMEDWEYCIGNTDLIVRAVNSHEQLVAALKAARIYVSIHGTDAEIRQVGDALSAAEA
jgi:hypothetical protein